MNRGGENRKIQVIIPTVKPDGPLIEGSYLYSLLKNISWSFDKMFTDTDKDDIMRNVSISETDAEKLVSTGLSKKNPAGNELGMWRELNESITGEQGIVVEHYFKNIYKKLACCLGKDTITINIPRYNRTTKKLERKEITISVDRAKECKMNGINWNDDNTTVEGHNMNCQRLIERLVAFLSKYDPGNPMIDTFGGCVANKHIGEDILKNPILRSVVDSNRSCTIQQCGGSAYKRKQDRQSCTTTICTANIQVSDAEAGTALNVLGNQIEQNCGAESALYKDLKEKGEETAKLLKEEEEAEKQDKTSTYNKFINIIMNFFNKFKSFFVTEKFTTKSSNMKKFIIIIIILFLFKKYINK